MDKSLAKNYIWCPTSNIRYIPAKQAVIFTDQPLQTGQYHKIHIDLVNCTIKTITQSRIWKVQLFNTNYLLFYLSFIDTEFL